MDFQELYPRLSQESYAKVSCVDSTLAIQSNMGYSKCTQDAMLWLADIACKKELMDRVAKAIAVTLKCRAENITKANYPVY